MSQPSGLHIWISAARPRTLPAAIAPVIAGSALAAHQGQFVLWAALTCLGFALLIQIGTNFANDYYDFVKGADTAERVGPRRAVAAGLVSPSTMRLMMWVVFGAAFLLGLSLLKFGGWPLMVIGLTSIFCGIAYTGGPYPLGYNGLGDLFVFLFFGLVAVGATYFVQTGRLTPESFMIGAVIGLLAANILVVNNYRDVETDLKAGKRTLVVRYGRGFARTQYVASLLIAFFLPVLLWLRGFSFWIFLPALLIPLGVKHWRRLRSATSPRELIVLLGDTGKLLALYALLLSAGILIPRLGLPH
jgi:1,4-dihydroxy-2-naphthoate octaprenyltransferase